jgi:surface antigen
LNNFYEHGASGHATSWKNPDSGNSDRVTPHTAYTEVSRPDRPCRRAEIDAVIDGKRKKTYSTACRDGNGQWILKS